MQHAMQLGDPICVLQQDSTGLGPLYLDFITELPWLPSLKNQPSSISIRNSASFLSILHSLAFKVLF